MKISNSMKRLEDIEAYLGFNDDKYRSAVKWCRKHNVPLFQIGKVTYASEQMFEVAISRIIRKDCFANEIDGDAVISAIEADDKVALAEIMSTPLPKNVKKAFTVEKQKKENDFEKVVTNQKKKSA